MKKYILLFSLILAGLFSCKKTTDNTSAQAAIDDATIQAYLKANNITTAVKDPSGLYYQIITPGSGPYPTAASSVSVSYTGSLLNGTIFETAPSSYFALSNTIQGWQIGVPHINAGGTILLLVPSALAYGTAGSGAIAANTVIMFKIGLQGFN